MDRQERGRQVLALGSERAEQPGRRGGLDHCFGPAQQLPVAITVAFPDAMVQICIVHLVRHSLNFCSWTDRKTVAADLRGIYKAPPMRRA